MPCENPETKKIQYFQSLYAYTSTARNANANGVVDFLARNPLLFIIVIKKGWQCKAWRERLTPYQSEDPNPTTPNHRMKEEKGKTAGDKK